MSMNFIYSVLVFRNFLRFLCAILNIYYNSKEQPFLRFFLQVSWFHYEESNDIYLYFFQSHTAQISYILFLMSSNWTFDVSKADLILASQIYLYSKLYIFQQSLITINIIMINSYKISAMSTCFSYLESFLKLFS